MKYESSQAPNATVEQVHPRHLSIQNFQVHYFDNRGEEIIADGHDVFTIEYTRYQDVLDLLPYREGDDGTLEIGIVKSHRPALEARSEIIEPLDGVADEQERGVLWEAPAAYMRLEDGETSLHETAHSILERKVEHAEPDGPLEILGGSYFPSVGGSTEIVFPRAIKVKKISNTHEDLCFVSVQDVVDGYFDGRYHSTRLLEVALRFARNKNIQVSFPHIDLPTSTHEGSDDEIKEKIATREEIRTLVSTTVHREGVAHVDVIPTEASPKPFLRVEKYKDNDIVVRKGVDSVDVGCYFWHNGKLYMPIKRGVRPSIAVRNLRPHPVHTDTSALFIEGIAGSLEGQKTLSELEDLAMKETEEEVGLGLTQRPTYIGFDYASPGHNPERTYRFLAEVDPGKPVHRAQGIDETTDIWYVDVEDILVLADEGIIKDPRLALNARILKGIFQYKNKDHIAPDATPEEVGQFQELINSGSSIQAWLSREAREVDNRLNESVLYRRLKMYCENELGVVAIDLPHPEEAHFFSAMIPVFAVPHPDDSRKLPFYFLHDLFHYATGDYLPIKKEGDAIVFNSLEEYQQACSGDESQAVWYSDVVMPKEFGLDRAEAIFQGNSVARAFLEIDMDEESARQAIHSIERNGVIPKNILNHPNFEKFRDVIIGRILRYHVLDRENTKNTYAYWTTHPHVAHAAIRFCHAFNDRGEYEKYYETSLDRVREYTEGINPLRAELSRTINYHIRLTALKIGFLQDRLSTLTGTHAVEYVMKDTQEYLDRLEDALHTLSSIRESVQDIDLSHTNLEAFRVLSHFQKTTLAEAKKFADDLARNHEFFSAEDIVSMEGRLLPHFESLKPVDPEFLKKELTRLEERSRYEKEQYPQSK